MHDVKPDLCLFGYVAPRGRVDLASHSHVCSRSAIRPLPRKLVHGILVTTDVPGATKWFCSLILATFACHGVRADRRRHCMYLGHSLSGWLRASHDCGAWSLVFLGSLCARCAPTPPAHGVAPIAPSTTRSGDEACRKTCAGLAGTCIPSVSCLFGQEMDALASTFIQRRASRKALRSLHQVTPRLLKTCLQTLRRSCPLWASQRSSLFWKSHPPPKLKHIRLRQPTPRR